jgi:hypothetical protein
VAVLQRLDCSERNKTIVILTRFKTGTKTHGRLEYATFERHVTTFTGEFLSFVYFDDIKQTFVRYNIDIVGKA